MTTEVIAGAGSVLGVLLGGRASTKTIARAGRAAGSAASDAGCRTVRGSAAAPPKTRSEATEEALAELEQEVLDEVAEIDAKWDELARAVETIEIRAEGTDVRVTELALVWVPTA